MQFQSPSTEAATKKNRENIKSVEGKPAHMIPNDVEVRTPGAYRDVLRSCM